MVFESLLPSMLAGATALTLASLLFARLLLLEKPLVAIRRLDVGIMPTRLSGTGIAAAARRLGRFLNLHWSARCRSTSSPSASWA